MAQAQTDLRGRILPSLLLLGSTGSAQPALEPALPKRSQEHYLWAVLIARIYEVLPREFNSLHHARC